MSFNFVLSEVEIFVNFVTLVTDVFHCNILLYEFPEIQTAASDVDGTQGDASLVLQVGQYRALR